MIQVTLAVFAVHDVGGIHCDIKPSNFMIEIDDTGKITLKLTDFGLCKVAEKDYDHLTKPKVIGSKDFISLAAHKNEVLTRVHDWQSVCFLVFKLLHPLPWQNIESESEIVELKEDFLSSFFWRDKVPEPILSYFDFIFEHTPD